MEIIPQDAIETIDDFMNHLSPEQIDGFGERFIGRHDNIDALIQAATKDLKNDDAKGLMYRLYVMVLKCFDYYALDFKNLPQDFMESEMLRWSLLFQKINPNFPDHAIVSLIKRQVIQKHLADYIVHYINEVPENTANFKKSELAPATLTMLFIANLLHNYILSLNIAEL